MAITGQRKPRKRKASPSEPQTAWGRALRAVLKQSKIPEARLAEQADVIPMTLNRYILGERVPDRQLVLRLNRDVATLVSGGKSIAPNLDVTKYLDAAAALSGRLPAESLQPGGSLSLDTAIDGACEALATLGAGILKADWYARLIAAVRDETVRNPSKFLLELNRLHGRLLLDAANGRVPATTGYEKLRDVLLKHRLSSLLEDDTQVADAFERLTLEIRKAVAEIADENATATDRFDAERKLLRSFATFASDVRRTSDPYLSAIDQFYRALNVTKG